MTDAALVEITRLLSRAREVADLVDGQDGPLRGSVNHAYVAAVRALRSHRNAHGIDEPNH